MHLTAATAPVPIARYDAPATEYSKICPTKHRGCEKSDCQIFTHDKEWERYPCSQCAYIQAVQTAKGIIGHGGTVVCNFGNFWQFLKDAQLVVVDEADSILQGNIQPENHEIL